MAFYNTGARYLFALAREGVLPKALGHDAPERHGPVVASMVVTAIVGVYMLGFAIMDPSTEAALLKLGTWTPLLGVLGILAVQGLCSVAIIRFFLTEARDGFHPVKTLIAPILGALAMAGACYLLISNRAVLSGRRRLDLHQGDPVRGARRLRRRHAARAVPSRPRDKETYAKVGRFSREEIPA